MSDLAAEHRARARAEVKIEQPAENVVRPPQGNDPASQHRRRAEAEPIVVQQTNQNFIRPGAATVASDVLASRLSNFATNEQIEFLAKQEEMKTGVAIRRQGESATAYAKRAKEVAKNGPGARTVVMDPQKAHRTLQKMERQYRLVAVDWNDERAAARATSDFEYMNSLRASLGMPPHDYRNESPADITADDHARFAKFQTMSDPGDRILACKTSTDGTLMRLVALNDSSVDVRVAAESRYAELLVGGR